MVKKVGIGVLILIVVGGIGATVWLLQRGQQLKSQAANTSPTQVFNVKDQGAKGDGVTDDTAPIQAAIELAEQVNGSAVFLPPGNYKISRLNFTHKDYISFVGVAQTGTHILSNYSELDKPVIDLTGANSIKLERFDLTMAPNTKAGVGILMARSKYRGCSSNELNNVGIYSRSQGGSYNPSDIGTWVVSPVFVFGCSNLTFFHPIIYNGQEGKGTVIITTNNDYGVKSGFTDIGDGVFPASGYRFYQAEVHNFVYTALGSLVLRGVTDITTYGGPFSSFKSPNIYLQDGASKVHIYGTTLYSESDARLGDMGDPRQLQRVPDYNVYIADGNPVSDITLDQTICQHKVGLFGGSSEATLSNIKVNCSFDEVQDEYVFNFSPSTNPSRVFLSNAYIMVPYQKIKPPASLGADVTFVNPGSFEIPAGALDLSQKIK